MTSGPALGGRRAAPGGGERSRSGPGPGLARLEAAAGAACRGLPPLGRDSGGAGGPKGTAPVLADWGSPQPLLSPEWAHLGLYVKVKWLR